MRPGVAFIEVLEEKLRAFTGDEPAPVAPRGFPTAPILGFFYFDPGLASSAMSSREAVGSPEASSRRTPSRTSRHTSWQTSWQTTCQTSPEQFRPRPIPPPQPQPRLTPRQRAALDVLTELGAAIGVDFTAEELRRTFRSLARQYHPDRHPGSSEGEKARLSTLFARLHDAYTHLHIAPVTAA